MKITAFFLLCLISGVSVAQGMAEPESPVSSDYMLRLVLGLTFIVALIFFLAKSFSRFNLHQGGSQGALKIIAGLPTGARDRIVLLQVGEEQVLLGLTPGRIEKLHTLSVPVETENAKEVVAGGFAKKLQTVLNTGKPQ